MKLKYYLIKTFFLSLKLEKTQILVTFKSLYNSLKRILKFEFKFIFLQIKLKSYKLNLLIARQAHNLKFVGSNPTPFNQLFNKINYLRGSLQSSDCGLFSILSQKRVSVLSHSLSLAARLMPFLS